LVLEQSTNLAERVIANASDDAALVTALYREIHLRDPSERELARSTAYLASARDSLGDAQDRATRAATSLAQALFASSEFLHVE
jgi:hypothetical protein